MAMRHLKCGCCTNGCMCAMHSAERERVVCLSHRLSAIAKTTLPKNNNEKTMEVANVGHC